jgi:hypothetical protein
MADEMSDLLLVCIQMCVGASPLLVCSEIQLWTRNLGSSAGIQAPSWLERVKEDGAEALRTRHGMRMSTPRHSIDSVRR